MNLIEQQNALKGLTDESLQAELSRPSGSTPPFLIATEVSRRKSARERYDGAKAKMPPTTVLQDLIGNGATEAAMGGMPPQAATPAGLEAAMPMADASMPQQTAFAEGGLVGALDYDAIGQRYADTLGGLGERRDRARALALLQAGGAIMGGGSSNFLTNLGKGVSAGASSYGTALDQIDQDEQRTLAAALDLQRAQQGDELTRLQFDWTKDRAGQEDALTREGWARNDVPASVREAQAFDEMTPAQQATYLKLNPPPATLGVDEKLAGQFDDIYQQVDKAYPPLASMDTLGKSAEEVAALIEARAQKVIQQTYARIKAAYGPEAAAKYARQAGIGDGAALTATPDGGSMGGDDPLGLGL